MVVHNWLESICFISPFAIESSRIDCKRSEQWRVYRRGGFLRRLWGRKTADWAAHQGVEDGAYAIHGSGRHTTLNVKRLPCLCVGILILGFNRTWRSTDVSAVEWQWNVCRREERENRLEEVNGFVLLPEGLLWRSRQAAHTHARTAGCCCAWHNLDVGKWPRVTSKRRLSFTGEGFLDF